MRFLLLFFLTIVGACAFSQKHFERDSVGRLIGDTPEFIIDNNNHNQFYQQARTLIKLSDRDSIFKAFRLLKRLYHFDSFIYSTNFLKKDFSVIEQKRFDYYQHNIVGEWKFQWAGSNWGTSETSANKKEKIIFTETEALFYKNDSLHRRTTYKFKNDFKGNLSKEIFFLLYFEDNKTAWKINFQNKGADYIAKLKFSKENVGLIVNEEPTCICGCPESIYLKNKPTYITHSSNSID